MKEKLTQELLRQSLDYNSLTGDFIWKEKIRRSFIGKKATCPNSRGYLLICLFGKSYYAHRLAWLYVNGYIPENEIDHINRDRADNRIKNLREVSRSCNLRNANLAVNNTSGVRGVSWNKKGCRYIAAIYLSGKVKHISSSKDFCEAVCFRLAAEQCLGWDTCDAESSAYKYIHKKSRN